MDLTEDTMEITSDNPEVGEGKELLSITAEIFEPEPNEAEEFVQGNEEGKTDHENEDGDGPSLPLRIGFNVRYLLEPLVAMKGEHSDPGNRRSQAALPDYGPERSSFFRSGHAHGHLTVAVD